MADDHHGDAGSGTVCAFSGWENASLIFVRTIGRRTGQPREKWWLVFGIDGNALYLLIDGTSPSDVIANIKANSNVDVWIDGGCPVACTAQLVTDPEEDRRARELVGQHQIGRGLQDLLEWGRAVVIRPRVEPIHDPTERSGTFPEQDL